MSRITSTFAVLQAQRRKALIPFITAGYPFADATPDIMHAMVAGGADIIELGVPFSDPSADGPVIQQAGELALSYGIGLPHIFDMVCQFRQRDTTTPVVLMGYANPIEQYDHIHATARPANHEASPFVRDAAAAGVDGVLVVDYPPEECTAFATQLRAHDMDLIFLLAPTSTEARMAHIARVASGYVYYVSLKGVTGSGALDTAAVQHVLPRIRQHIRIPVGVGFGIRDAVTARSISQVADAVVIGSKIIQLLGDQTRENVASAARNFLQNIRMALDQP